MAKDENVRPIVIKKVKKVIAGGHHGGAWKVAYADFTTAMMAFFMLLWLLNASDQETLEGLADYFTPTTASLSTASGSGRILGGTTPAVSDGNQSSATSVVQIPASPPSTQEDTIDQTSGSGDSDSEGDRGTYLTTLASYADPALDAAAEQISQVMQSIPALAPHGDQLMLEQTQDGMRIQIFDRDRRPMFRTGTADLYGYARNLILEIGTVIESLPNRVSIVGHTDGLPFARDSAYSNWELSSDRANAARRVLSDAGITPDRFSEVVGKASTDPMFPDDPGRPENRRITIIVLREAPVFSPSFDNN